MVAFNKQFTLKQDRSIVTEPVSLIKSTYTQAFHMQTDTPAFQLLYALLCAIFNTPGGNLLL